LACITSSPTSLTSSTPKPQPLNPETHRPQNPDDEQTGKHSFTMDYQWPMSAMQAFCICLSSFDNKLACE